MKPTTKVTKLADLKPDKRNANKGTKRGAAMIEASLKDYGAGRSVLLDKNLRVIAGNKTLENARKAGFTDLIVVKTDGKRLVAVQREDLDLSRDKKARQLAVADNRTGEVNLDWDWDVLRGMKDDLGPFFDEKELAKLYTSDGTLLQKLDVTIEEPKTQVELGDVYQLGRHTLCCMSVVADWRIYNRYLTAAGDVGLFCPFPGPMVALSKKADEHVLVLVQPDEYIAGHIVDRFIDICGKKAVKKLQEEA